ncbi:helix-turn-helix transcriptional regulator [Paenibacillus cremeus]|nr:AraC family transcriptional regulator [Paenibacillus cremeus]
MQPAPMIEPVKKYFGYKPVVTQQKSIESNLSLEYAHVIELEEKLCHTVMKCTPRRLQETMDFIDATLDFVPSADTVTARRVYLHLIHALLRTVYKSGVSLGDVLSHHADYHASIEQAETKQEIHAFVGDLCATIGRYMMGLRMDKNHRIVWEVKAYIEAHFNVDFGLEQLSERMNCSATYINRLLKQHTGSTFYNLLTEKRIACSKQLLTLNDWTINQISSEVGYNNVHSFIRAFKRSEGLTPGQFRDLMVGPDALYAE